MYAIDTHSDLLAQILQNQNVRMDQQGKWTVEGWKSRLVRWIKPIDRFYNKILVGKTIELIEGLEKIHILFSRSSESELPQSRQIQSYLLLAKKVIRKYEDHSDLHDQIQKLRCYCIGLKYRLQNSQSNEVYALEKVEDIFSKWKKVNPMKGDREVNFHEKKVLEKTCHYRSFVKLLLRDSSIREEYFKWVSEGNEADPFIQFPAKATSLTWHSVSKILGHHGGHQLQVEVHHTPRGCYKDLTMLFEGKRESILDDRKVVVLKHGYSLTLAEIFYIFRKRAEGFGNVEFSSTKGFINWNPIKMGSYDPLLQSYHQINLDVENWYTQLEPTAIYSLDQAQKIFKDIHGNSLECDGQRWMIGFVCTNAHEEILVQDAHAFLGVGIPDENKNYHFYPFGKFTQEFPPDLPESLQTFTQKAKALIQCFRALIDHLKGGIAYPDENIRNNRFSHASYFSLTPEEGKSRLHKLREDLRSSRQGQLYFQYLSRSCIHWCYEILRSDISKDQAKELNGIHLFDVKTTGILKYFYRFLGLFSQENQVRVMNFLMKILKPNRVQIVGKKGEMKWISIVDKAPWADKCLHPGVLIQKKKLI